MPTPEDLTQKGLSLLSTAALSGVLSGGFLIAVGKGIAWIKGISERRQQRDTDLMMRRQEALDKMTIELTDDVRQDLKIAREETRLERERASRAEALSRQLYVEKEETWDKLRFFYRVAREQYDGWRNAIQIADAWCRQHSIPTIAWQLLPEPIPRPEDAPRVPPDGPRASPPP